MTFGIVSVVFFLYYMSKQMWRRNNLMKIRSRQLIYVLLVLALTSCSMGAADALSGISTLPTIMANASTNEMLLNQAFC